MGMRRGKWQAEAAPHSLKYPYEVAAKLVTCIKSVTQEEVRDFVIIANRLNELCLDQDTVIRELKKELYIAEQTVKLLQVGENHDN